ncbi:MAG: hypothetical protein DDT34_00022 [Firmicutes bacterium]|nr:hypothetical protein [Bacillota bacterium]
MEKYDVAKLENALHQLPLPTITTPLHKERLRLTLLAEVEATQKRELPWAAASFWDSFVRFARPRYLYLGVPLVAVMVWVVLWQALFVTPPTMAYATLQANPALQLTIDTRGRVTATTPLNPLADSLFAPQAFRHVSAQVVVQEIISRLYSEGYLQRGGSLAFLVHPAPNIDQSRISPLANSLRSSADHSLSVLGSGATLKDFVVSGAVSAEYRAAGLLPLEIVLLLDEDFEEEEIISLLRLREQLSLDETTFRARFPGMAKAVREARREKLPRDKVLDLGRKFLASEEDDEEEEKEDDRDEAEVEPPRLPRERQDQGRNEKPDDRDDAKREPRQEKDPKDKDESVPPGHNRPPRPDDEEGDDGPGRREEKPPRADEEPVSPRGDEESDPRYDEDDDRGD